MIWLRLLQSSEASSIRPGAVQHAWPAAGEDDETDFAANAERRYFSRNASPGFEGGTVRVGVVGCRYSGWKNSRSDSQHWQDSQAHWYRQGFENQGCLLYTS